MKQIKHPVGSTVEPKRKAGEVMVAYKIQAIFYPITTTLAVFITEAVQSDKQIVSVFQNTGHEMKERN